MNGLCQPGSLKRFAAMFLVVAVAWLPLMHTGNASAAGQANAGEELCAVDLCGCCPAQSIDAAVSYCGDSDLPDTPAPCEDAPCDCPCCGKVLPVVSMISNLPTPGLFWDPSPTPSWTPHVTRPKSAAMRVDIQPPIA